MRRMRASATGRPGAGAAGYSSMTAARKSLKTSENQGHEASTLVWLKHVLTESQIAGEMDQCFRTRAGSSAEEVCIDLETDFWQTILRGVLLCALLECLLGRLSFPRPAECATFTWVARPRSIVEYYSNINEFRATFQRLLQQRCPAIHQAPPGSSPLNDDADRPYYWDHPSILSCDVTLYTEAANPSSRSSEAARYHVIKTINMMRFFMEQLSEIFADVDRSGPTPVAVPRSLANLFGPAADASPASPPAARSVATSSATAESAAPEESSPGQTPSQSVPTKAPTPGDAATPPSPTVGPELDAAIGGPSSGFAAGAPPSAAPEESSPGQTPSQSVPTKAPTPGDAATPPSPTVGPELDAAIGGPSSGFAAGAPPVAPAAAAPSDTSLETCPESAAAAATPSEGGLALGDPPRPPPAADEEPTANPAADPAPSTSDMLSSTPAPGAPAEPAVPPAMPDAVPDAVPEDTSPGEALDASPAENVSPSDLAAPMPDAVPDAVPEDTSPGEALDASPAENVSPSDLAARLDQAFSFVSTIMEIADADVTDSPGPPAPPAAEQPSAQPSDGSPMGDPSVPVLPQIASMSAGKLRRISLPPSRLAPPSVPINLSGTAISEDDSSSSDGDYSDSSGDSDTPPDMAGLELDAAHWPEPPSAGAVVFATAAIGARGSTPEQPLLSLGPGDFIRVQEPPAKATPPAAAGWAFGRQMCANAFPPGAAWAAECVGFLQQPPGSQEASMPASATELLVAHRPAGFFPLAAVRRLADRALVRLSTEAELERDIRTQADAVLPESLRPGTPAVGTLIDQPSRSTSSKRPKKPASGGGSIGPAAGGTLRPIVVRHTAADSPGADLPGGSVGNVAAQPPCALSQSHVLWRDTVDPALAEALPRDALRRQEAIFELVRTEGSYLRDLLVLELYFQRPLRQVGLLSLQDPVAGQAAGMPAGHLAPDGRLPQTRLFGQLAVLRDISARLYGRLRAAALACPLVDVLAPAIRPILPLFRAYVAHCSGTPAALALVAALRAGEYGSRAADALRGLDGAAFLPGSPARGLALSSFLLTPAQRVCKYPLLLREILRYTPEGHPDQAALVDILQQMTDIVNMVNEEKRALEAAERLVAFERRFAKLGQADSFLPGPGFGGGPAGQRRRIIHSVHSVFVAAPPPGGMGPASKRRSASLVDSHRRRGLFGERVEPALVGEPRAIYILDDLLVVVRAVLGSGSGAGGAGGSLSGGSLSAATGASLGAVAGAAATGGGSSSGLAGAVSGVHPNSLLDGPPAEQLPGGPARLELVARWPLARVEAIPLPGDVSGTAMIISLLPSVLLSKATPDIIEEVDGDPMSSFLSKLSGDFQSRPMVFLATRTPEQRNALFEDISTNLIELLKNRDPDTLSFASYLGLGEMAETYCSPVEEASAGSATGGAPSVHLSSSSASLSSVASSQSGHSVSGGAGGSVRGLSTSGGTSILRTLSLSSSTRMSASRSRPHILADTFEQPRARALSTNSSNEEGPALAMGARDPPPASAAPAAGQLLLPPTGMAGGLSRTGSVDRGPGGAGGGHLSPSPSHHSFRSSGLSIHSASGAGEYSPPLALADALFTLRPDGPGLPAYLAEFLQSDVSLCRALPSSRPSVSFASLESMAFPRTVDASSKLDASDPFSLPSFNVLGAVRRTGVKNRFQRLTASAGFAFEVSIFEPALNVLLPVQGEPPAQRCVYKTFEDFFQLHFTLSSRCGSGRSEGGPGAGAVAPASPSAQDSGRSPELLALLSGTQHLSSFGHFAHLPLPQVPQQSTLTSETVLEEMLEELNRYAHRVVLAIQLALHVAVARAPAGAQPEIPDWLLTAITLVREFCDADGAQLR
ncbi:hypothetical protein H696_01284 [Fonticula alba]|uniref:DH domain-containing protein n=1 Tax=Fonticula alba TaxID=691883 RepID=A0A058ZD65_FONAL|nr:hypothetical protein H696_01284 [Fonticula alba]KCV71873.1 hypothetical protein H696_01284 [Fonticula alba]|eukprot:XP_009493451.1 hypothetical protein H696_01284 [Fonticula alba]